MVGDDWERDIEPAAAVGLSVFWIAGEADASPSDEVELIGKGPLAKLWEMFH